MIDQLLSELTANRLASQSDLRGASESDIAGLEELVRVRLPSPYKAFLRAVGRGAGRFLRSDHWSFKVDALPQLNADARPLLDAAGLQGPWFCFATRMGEIYLFFLADGVDDDPPVYFWNERSDPRIDVGFGSIGEWLRSMVEEFRSPYPHGGAAMEWLDPWWSTAEQAESFHAAFEAQLRLELCEDDPVYGVPAKIIGRGNGDDALFELLDGSGRVAFVHLQWGKLPGRIGDEFRTRSRVYASVEAFRLQHMIPEHHEWLADQEV